MGQSINSYPFSAACLAHVSRAFFADTFSLNFLTAGRANLDGGGCSVATVIRRLGLGLLVGENTEEEEELSLPSLARLLVLLDIPAAASSCRAAAFCSICDLI